MAQLHRWAGPSGMLGGVLWTGFHLWYAISGADLAVDAAARKVVAVAGIAVLLMALTWLSISRRPPNNAASRAAALTCVAGTALVAAGALIRAAGGEAASRLVAVAGQSVNALGMLAFGAMTLIRRILPRFNLLPLLMVLVYVPSLMVPGAFPSTFPHAFPEILAVLYGLGRVTLGLIL